MIKVYGINSCSSFKKGVKYFEKHNIEIVTYDLKVTVPTKEEMKKYLTPFLNELHEFIP